MVRRGTRQVVRLSPRGMRIVHDLRARFAQKFGRPPGPGDPLSFDVEADNSGSIDQERFEALVSAAMETAGVDPRVIHAFRRTGLLVTEHNVRDCSPAELERWQAALE